MIYRILLKTSPDSANSMNKNVSIQVSNYPSLGNKETKSYTCNQDALKPLPAINIIKTPNNVPKIINVVAETRFQHIENLAAFLWRRFLYYVIAASGLILSDAVTYIERRDKPPWGPGG